MTTNFLPRRLFPLLSLFCLLLCACSLTSQLEQTPPARYDLGAAPLTTATEKGIPLTVEVRLPSWLDSTAMHYRLLYENPRQMHEYAFSRWAAAPSKLLTQRLQARLGESSSASSSPCLLRIDVDEFGQLFDEATASHGLIAARATLLDKKRQALAQTRYRGVYPAATANAQGGVAALSAAADDLAETLLRWRGDLKANGSMNSCLP